MGARVERAIAVAVLAVRATFVVQMVLAVIDVTTRADRPFLFAGFAVAMILESALLAGVLLRSNSMTRTAAVIDILFIIVMILAEPLYSSPADRVGTWAAWGFAAGGAASLSAGTGLRSLRGAGLAGVALAAAYLAVSLPAASGTGMAGTALTNSVALVGFAVGSWVTARYGRNLAGIADAALAEAADVARRAAVDRQRMLLHDQATVLSLLSQTGLNLDLDMALRDQAARGSQQIRAFLAQEDLPAADRTSSDNGLPLPGVLATAVGEFADLPLTMNIDLVAGLRLSGSAGEALAAALRTLLHNVRQHARATAVTLHADRLPDGAWEVTVQDDGVGIESDRAAGFGLTVQAGSALREAGMSVTVESAPTDGTTVTIVGPTLVADA
jgi:signal transduction histidine kinase